MYYLCTYRITTQETGQSPLHPVYVTTHGTQIRTMPTLDADLCIGLQCMDARSRLNPIHKVMYGFNFIMLLGSTEGVYKFWCAGRITETFPLISLFS